ncbi:MAG: GEVED domain-containing protein [Planctomycetota bacterium]
MYFGYNGPFQNGVPDLVGPESTGLSDSYNFPGGAAGAIESAPFSLEGIAAKDSPTLYFTYLFDSEDASSTLPTGSTIDDYMRDSLRVYASSGDGQWSLLATNNDTGPGQKLFDNVGVWRQARVPLDNFAGEEAVTLRIEFSTHGGFGFGMDGGQGPEIRTTAGEVLADGEQLVIDGRTFELEIGPTLTLPGSSAISNGDYVTIEGTRYVFTDGSLTVVAPDVPVPYAPRMGSNQVALALQNAIATATIPPTTVTGRTFNNEENDIITIAEQTNINGEASVIISGAGEIGDNTEVPNEGEDVDLFRIDVQRGAVVEVQVDAVAIGSALDTYLRVFDEFGNPLRNANGNIIFSDDAGGTTDSFLSFVAPETGTYYLGVSGGGNENYIPTVKNTSIAGSVGFYNITIDVEKLLNPVVAGNRLQLQGAGAVTLPNDSPILSQGQFGSTGVPVHVTLDMTPEEVAFALQASLANFFAGGVTSAYPVNRNTVDLTGLVDYSLTNPATGLPMPSVNDLSPGPFDATTTFIGDAYGSFNESTNFDGSVDRFSPGHLGGQNNDFEGVYLDDFIIGVAGRGEMVLNAASNTEFVASGTGGSEITLGEYQLEIRGGEEYGVPNPGGISLTDTFPFDARTVESLSVRFNSTENMIAGDTFEIGDGTRSLIFEMDDVNDGVDTQPGNIPLEFNTAVFNPLTGSTFVESAETIASRFRDIVNSPIVQDVLDISANLLNNDRIGSTSPTVALIGTASASVPPTVGQVIVSELKGGDNRAREQGQVIINATRIANALEFGISVSSAPNDPATGNSTPAAPRNLITLNAENLVPGAVIMNSELISNTAGGINVNGPTLNDQLPPGARPFVRVVNNTIVGGTITEVTGLNPTVEGGQVFESGFLAFADNVVSYNNLLGGLPPVAGLDNPIQATGAPNFTGTGEPAANENVVSLGRGGQIVLEFNNNFLTGSGDAEPDLMIFEVGDSEEVQVELSVDGVSFTDVGRASGASPTIDIDAFGFSTTSRIPFVRLTDLINQGAQTGDSVGADIDAVGAISSVAADISTPGGQGIVIGPNSTATLLNNIVVNSATAIEVDVTSDDTVIGGTVYQNNQANVAGSATLGQFSTVLEDNIPMFVSPGRGNFYPSAGSPIIDASIDTLADRPELFAVKEPLGIATSPILAPTFDISGQLRVNDPLVEAPAGLGANVFKDRGSQDRGDFVGPSAVLLNPLDNDNAGLDSNPDTTTVELTNIALTHFDIRLVDGIAPSDPTPGTGIDHTTVTSPAILLFRNDVPLVEGLDYRFGYDSTNGVIRLTPLAGLWQQESVYTIRFINSSESAIVALPAEEYSDGSQFKIIDGDRSETTFELDLGFLIDIPTGDGTDANITDGTAFILDDGVIRTTFELDTDGSILPDRTAVSMGQDPTLEAAANALAQAINNSGLLAVASVTHDNKVQVESDAPLRFTNEGSALTVSGLPGVQTVFGLQIPLEAGLPSPDLLDGQTFGIENNGTTTVFELDTNGGVLAGNVPVQYPANANAQTIGEAIANAVENASIGLAPSYDGNGIVRLGGGPSVGLDLANTILTQTGAPGELAAIRVAIDYDDTSSQVASKLLAAIEAANLSGVSATQFGARLIISGVQAVSGEGANQIRAVRDLAGNSLKPNRDDGTTQLNIFMGEGFDFGDAAEPYDSRSNANGPRHTVITGLHLGPDVTVDADAKVPDGDLDDGVTFGNLITAFQGDVTIDVTNTTGETAYASVWVDFDGDGFFELRERVFGPNPVSAGSTTISFPVPIEGITNGDGVFSTVGETVVRVRLSTDENAILNPVGEAQDGEVEDHVVTLQANPYQNPGNNLDINGDGFVSAIDALQIVARLNQAGLPSRLTLPAPNAPPYYDVDGDGFVTAIDALEVISFLNARTGEGEFQAGLNTDMGLADFDLGNQMVLASDWAPGIENMVTELRRHRPSAQDVIDAALVDADTDEAMLAGLPVQGQNSVSDLAWAELNDEDDRDDDIFSSLADEML